MSLMFMVMWIRCDNMEQNELCQEFSEALGVLLNKYAEKVPLGVIIKILSSVSIDLQKMETGLLIQQALTDLQEEVKKSLESRK